MDVTVGKLARRGAGHVARAFAGATWMISMIALAGIAHGPGPTLVTREWVYAGLVLAVVAVVGASDRVVAGAPRGKVVAGVAFELARMAACLVFYAAMQGFGFLSDTFGMWILVALFTMPGVMRLVDAATGRQAAARSV